MTVIIEQVIQVVILTIYRKLKIISLNTGNGNYIPRTSLDGTIRHNEPYLIVEILHPFGETALVDPLLIDGLLPIERFLIKRDLYSFNHLTDDYFRPSEDTARLICDISHSTVFV